MLLWFVPSEHIPVVETAVTSTVIEVVETLLLPPHLFFLFILSVMESPIVVIAPLDLVCFISIPVPQV